MIWQVYGFEWEVSMVSGFPPDNLGKHYIGLAWATRMDIWYGETCWDGGQPERDRRKAKRVLNRARKAHQNGVKANAIQVNKAA